MSGQSLAYVIIKNPLKKGGEFIAKPINQLCITQDSIIEKIANKGYFTKDVIRYVLNSFKSELITELSYGNNIVTEFGTFKLSLKGTYDDYKKNFTEREILQNNILRLNFNPAHNLLSEVKHNIKLHKVNYITTTAPNISEVFNVSTKEKNANFAGNIITIKGSSLKFNPQMNDEGIFLRSDDFSFYCTYINNQPKNLSFQIPYDLSEGLYSLQVSSRCGRKNNLYTDSISFPVIHEAES